MDTLKLVNKDITIDNRGRIETVGGANKVAQDLKEFLLNDLSYNRFHPWIGSHLDDFVGQPIDETLLQRVKSDVRDCLNLYTEVQIADLNKRISERGSPEIAIQQADPSSIVKEWGELSVSRINTSMRIRISFTTYTNETANVDLSLSTGGFSNEEAL